MASLLISADQLPRRVASDYGKLSHSSLAKSGRQITQSSVVFGVGELSGGDSIDIYVQGYLCAIGGGEVKNRSGVPHC